MSQPEFTLNGRPVVDIELEYRGVDSFITSANWDDTGEALTDDELEALQDAASDLMSERIVLHYGYFPK